MSADVGPMPEPEVEAPELFPGGTDAVDDQRRYAESEDAPESRDLDTATEPGLEAVVPDEVQQLDDTQQESAEEPDDGHSEPSA